MSSYIGFLLAAIYCIWDWEEFLHVCELQALSFKLTSSVCDLFDKDFAYMPKTDFPCWNKEMLEA